MNVNAHHAGRRVRTIREGVRTLAQDFPGWDDPNYAAFFVDQPIGVEGTVTSVESHGSNPWTRYTIKLDDGTRKAGACLDLDIEFI